jgi:hypothetical protein
MKNQLPNEVRARIEREIERERNERILQDETRVGLSGSDEFRIKDARESVSGNNLKRSSGR